MRKHPAPDPTYGSGVSLSAWNRISWSERKTYFFFPAGRPLFFGHIAAPELLSELAESLGVEEKLVAEIGGVVGSHVGPGAYGVAHL